MSDSHKREHYRHKHRRDQGGEGNKCIWCDQPYPCDVIKVLDEWGLQLKKNPLEKDY